MRLDWVPLDPSSRPERIGGVLAATVTGFPRVLVLTAEEGEGHYAAAGALAHELLEEAGAEVVVRDAYKGDFGRIVPFFSRDAYHFQVRCAPWTYWLEYLFFVRFPIGRLIARSGLALFASRPLRR